MEQTFVYMVIGVTTVLLLTMVTICSVWLGRHWKPRKRQKTNRPKRDGVGHIRKEFEESPPIEAAEYKENQGSEGEKVALLALPVEIKSVGQQDYHSLETEKKSKRRITSNLQLPPREPKDIPLRTTTVNNREEVISNNFASTPNETPPPIQLNVIPAHQILPMPPADELPVLVNDSQQHSALQNQPIPGKELLGNTAEVKVKEKPKPIQGEGGSLSIKSLPRRRRKARRKRPLRRGHELLTNQKATESVLHAAQSAEDLNKDLRVLLSNAPRKHASLEILIHAQDTVDLEDKIRSTLTKECITEEEDKSQT